METAHPEIFTTMPRQPTEKKPGQLPVEKIREYFEEGILLVEDFFKDEQLVAVKKDVETVVDEFATRLHRAGKINNLYKEYGLFERLTHIEGEFPGATIVIMKEGKLTQGIKNLWSNERLLNVIEQLIGPDIMGHPVWNLRPKVPQNEATIVPWHQDVAYLDSDSYSVLQVSAWIPLLDTNRTNGCMEMIRRVHQSGKVAKHTGCWRNTWYVHIDEDELRNNLGVNLEEDVELVAVPYKGMVLFNNLVPHQSLPNLSKTIRWTLDLRWQTPHHSVGFHGLKHGVLMRDSKNPHHKIDWETFEGTSEKDADTSEDADVEEFNTIVVGPWMTNWERTHENRHTAQLAEGKLSWHAQQARI